MQKRNFKGYIYSQRLAFGLAAMLFIAGSFSRSFSQTPASSETPAAAVSSVVQDDSPKVSFDENSPGVVIIESNGKKFRVDSTKKTIEPFIEKAKETVAETPKKEEPKATDVAKAADKSKKDDSDGTEYDFDPGYEPYDYHLVNLPTPKSVPKGTWNMNFSHRFSQSLYPLKESAKTLLGFDSFSTSSFGMMYGITDKLYVNAYRSPLCQRGLCRTIEVGFGYHLRDITKKSPVAMSVYASAEGDENFTKHFTYNLQAMMAAKLGKRVYLFFSPAIHLKSNGERRFDPRADDYFPPATVANNFKLPVNTASFGFGSSVMITPTVSAFFEYTPRIGFKLGRVDPIFNSNFDVVGFNPVSEPALGFGVQKNIGKHSFSITLSNTQTSTTSRYNSSNSVATWKNMSLGFNLFRRW